MSPPRLDGGSMPVDDPGEVGAGRQGPEGLAPVATESRRAERTRDRLVTEAQQQGALEGERHSLDELPGARLDALDLGEVPAQIGDMRVEPRLARSLADLGEEGVDGIRALDHRPQDIEALDVARALPDRGEWGLAIEARHARLLDVAVAAEALQAL